MAKVKSEVEKLTEQSKAFEENLQQLTMDRMNEAPKLEVEPQTKLSSKELDKSKDIYLKPIRTLGSREKFNEKFREDYDFSKEYVQFIAENREIIGEDIEMWTKPFPGLPAEMWRVPTNKPVWGPRYLAEQIKKCYYHKLIMENKVIGSSSEGQYYGSMVADHTVNRLDAIPVSGRRSVFMGAA